MTEDGGRWPVAGGPEDWNDGGPEGQWAEGGLRLVARC